MYKLVSVIMPLRNEEEHLERCLQSIAAQDYPRDRLEVLAIEGMSEDRTRPILNRCARNLKSVRVIDNPGRIVPKALNLGIRESKGDIIIRMDAHSTYPADYIRKCVEYLERTRYENVGGIIEHVGKGYVGGAIALAQGSIFGLGGAKFRSAKDEEFVDTVFPGAWERRIFEEYWDR